MWLAGTGEDQNYICSIALPQGGWRAPKRAEATKTAAPALRSATSLKDKAIELARKPRIARTCDFAEIGISRHYLCKLCAEGFLARVGYDLYAAPKDTA